MRFSLDWLRQFVPIDLSPQKLAERLTLAGFAVEAIESFSPPSDPLGAPDTVLEVEVTSNRPDAMNHLGLAREIAAILDLPLTPPAPTLTEDTLPVSGAASVAIEAEDLCPRYVARVVSGVTVGDSPVWIKRRLEAAGLACKNNIVDASNYVLLELGQPLHAFDLSRLAGGGVTVRRARAGETIVTVVDRVEKTLLEDMLVIAQAGAGGRPGRPAAIAGVMGGFDTAISEHTREVLVESAWFDPGSVRKTARALDLHTDASHRFERGSDPAIAGFAADRLAALIAETAGGKILAGAIDVRASKRPALELVFDPVPPATAQATARLLPLLRRATPVTLRRDHLADLIGIDPSAREIEATIERLGIEMVPRPTSGASTAGRKGSCVDVRSAGTGGDTQTDAPSWDCFIPSWRWDITRPEDLIEDYARLTGYDRIPETLPSGPGPLPRPNDAAIEDRARDLLSSCGYHEAINYAMVPKGDDALFGPLGGAHGDTPEPRLIIANPLSERWEAMRRSLLPGLARAFAFNMARGRADLRLFEVGTVHHRGPDGQPVEQRSVALGGSGIGSPPAWPGPANPVDMLEIKGAIEALALALGFPPSHHDGRTPPSTGQEPGLRFEPPTDGGATDGLQSASGTARWPFHPGQSFLVTHLGRRIGRGGRVHPEVAHDLEIERPLFLAEILLEPFPVSPCAPRYEPLSKLNPVERDLSFFVDRAVPYAQVDAAVIAAAAAVCSEETGALGYSLLDRFEGETLPRDRVSYTFRFRFSPRTKPLTADQLNGTIERIAETLAGALGAEIRSR